MDLDKALLEGTMMKFNPPDLGEFIAKLKAIEELFLIPRTEIKMSVEAVHGLYALVEDIGSEIGTFAQEEIAGQIDEAPEPSENENRKEG